MKEWTALKEAIYAPRSKGRMKEIRRAWEAYESARRPWWRRRRRGK